MILSVGQLSAQEYTVSVQQFGIEEGLPHRVVAQVYKDKSGFLWVFGYGYALRYDGYEFKPYMSLAGITQMGEDAEGWIWLLYPDQGTTGSKLNYLHPLTGELRSKEQQLGPAIAAQLDRLFDTASYQFYCHKTSDGKERWHFGGRNEIVLFDARSGIKKIPLSYVESAPIQIALVDREGNFWVHGKPGIIKKLSPKGVLLDSARIANRILDQSFCFKTNSVFEWQGHIYLRELSGAKNQLFRIEASGEKKRVFEDPEGYCFFEFLEGQIWCLGPAGWKIFDTNGDLLLELKRKDYDEKLFNVLDYGNIQSDGTGKFYLNGSLGFNIIEIQKNPFTHYFSRGKGASLPINNEARGIYAEQDSILVNFERGGFVFFKKDQPKAYKIVAIALENNPEISTMYNGLSILRDRAKNFWIGHAACLEKWSPDLSRRQQFPFSKAIQSYNTRALWEDKAGCIWYFTNLGFGKICPKQTVSTGFSYQETGFDFKGNLLVFQIQPEENGQLWLCTANGLYLFDTIQKKPVAHYHTAGQGKYQLPDNDIYCMYVDAKGDKWLGTHQGLLFWDTGTGEKRLFGRQEGMFNTLIYSIYEDEYKRLWLSSEYGIMSFDKETFDVQTYLVKDGISDIEFNGNSHFQASDGTIYFGGTNGVNAFHPRDFVKREKDPAQLVLLDFELFDGKAQKTVNQLPELIATQTITFHPSDRYFKLKFVLPNLDKVRKAAYAWRIDGITDDWNYQKENTLQFGALPYGNHRLRIKGQSAAGGWSPQELDLVIRVLKPFYLQTWFIALSILALIGGLFWYIKRRTRLLLQTQQKLETEIKKATAQIEYDKKTIEQQAEELRQLDKIKSRFFANISHEFRTPLTLILGPVSQALQHSKQLGAPALELIQRNGRQLLRLINQILDLSKMEEGKLKVYFLRGDVIALLGRMVEPFESYAQSNHKQVHFQTSLQSLEMDYDKQKLHDILSNLLSNALKYTQEGDTIAVSAEQAGSDFLLSVKDSGAGIAAEDLPYLFDRFYQIESHRSNTPTKGSGIGLSLTKQLVELLGGSMEVESQLGEGSTFTVRLPIQLEAAQKDEDFTPVDIAIPVPLRPSLKTIEKIWPAKAIGKDSIRVLIVEDTPDLAQYIASCLPGSYRISFAENGQAGIDQALEDIPDIVISDVMMPEKDGFELCQTLKADTRTSHIPIILLTALADAEARVMGLRRGADAYLAKPFDEDELRVRVVKLLELRQSLQARYANGQSFALDQAAGQDAGPEAGLIFQSEDAFLTKVHKIIDQHLSDTGFGVLQLGDLLHMSQSPLLRKVSALTGMSVVAYIRNYRLHKGRELLKISDLKVAEVAYTVGFSDPRYFSRKYAETFGEAPADSRG